MLPTISHTMQLRTQNLTLVRAVANSLRKELPAIERELEVALEVARGPPPPAEPIEQIWD